MLDFVTDIMTEGSGDTDDVNCSWEYSDVLSQKLSWERWAVSNTVDLLDKGNTIPFIARYRKEQTNNMQSETLRRLSDIYDDLRWVVLISWSAVAQG